jgi:acyl dehydratase
MTETIQTFQQLVDTYLNAVYEGDLPIRPGTCITGHSQIQSVTFRPERRDGVVIVKTELTDGSGQTILTVVADALIHARPNS